MSGLSQTNSASLFKAEQEIKQLKRENEKLKKDLSESSALWKQLVQENSYEKFDERRVNFMKAQMIQLEKQILLLSEGLSLRSESALEVENALGSISDKCKSYVVKGQGSVGEVRVTRADLSYITETAESARIKLYKTLENTSQDQLSRPLLMMNQYVKQKDNDPVTWLNVCSGKLDHLNLRNVAKLESNLVILYKELLVLLNSIQPLTSVRHEVNKELPVIVYDQVAANLAKSCKLLKDSSTELLQLSVLVPSAPWSKISKPVIRDITTDQVMKIMPPLPKSKLAEVKQAVETMQKAITYQNIMLQHEIKVLKQELEFHISIYDLQQDYMQTMFTSLSEGYESFEKDVRFILCEPLQDILKSYDILKKTAAESALKDFLSKFKQNEGKISDSVQKLSVDLATKQGKDAISEFGEEYFKSLSKLQQEAMRKRDTLIQQLECIKTEKEKYVKECEECILYSENLHAKCDGNVSEGTVSAANFSIGEGEVRIENKSVKKTKNKKSSPKNFVILSSNQRKDSQAVRETPIPGDITH